MLAFEKSIFDFELILIAIRDVCFLWTRRPCETCETRTLPLLMAKCIRDTKSKKNRKRRRRVQPVFS